MGLRSQNSLTAHGETFIRHISDQISVSQPSLTAYNGDSLLESGEDSRSMSAAQNTPVHAAGRIPQNPNTIEFMQGKFSWQEPAVKLLRYRNYTGVCTRKIHLAFGPQNPQSGLGYRSPRELVWEESSSGRPPKHRPAFNELATIHVQRKNRMHGPKRQKEPWVSWPCHND